MRDIQLTKYELAHRFCPICYSASHWATTSPTYSDTYNQNDSRCIDCGWGGKVHDRLSREEVLYREIKKAEAMVPSPPGQLDI